MRGLVKSWIWCSAPLLLMGLSWALANPIAAPPDEPTHVIRADALVHGQLVGRAAPAGAPRAITTVTVPQVIAQLQADAACLDQGPSVPAACLQHIGGSQQKVAQNIYVGRYPPAYYAIVGLASYASQGPKLVYLMRGFTALMVSLLIGLAIALSQQRRTGRSAIAVVGPLAASTPMVLNLAGAVNPNGPEIGAAICLWVSAVTVALLPSAQIPRYLLSIGAVAASALVLLRGLSPLWLLLALVGVAPLVDRRKLTELARRLDARVAGIAVAVVTVAALAWIVAAGSLATLNGIPVPAGSSDSRLVRIAVDHLYVYAKQAVGNFGRLDSPVPLFCVVVVTAALVTLLGTALWRSSTRARLALLITVALSVAVPVALIVLTGRKSGLVEQGRYFLPLWVGIPILAAASVRNGSPETTWPWLLRRLLVVLLAVSDLVAFYGGLRRYTVGVRGPLDPFAHPAGAWKPPLPAWALDAGFLVAGGLLVIVLWGRSSSEGFADRGGEQRPLPGVEDSSAVERLDVENVYGLRTEGANQRPGD